MSGIVWLMRTVFLIAIGFLCCGLPAFSQSTTIDPVDLVHVGDVVDVDFVGGSDNDWRGSVGPDGTLTTFPSYTEPISVVCRDVDSIAADIATAYSKVLRDPKVLVRIVDRSKRPPVVLLGAIRTPARFSVRRPVSLRELIVRSGGFTDELSGEITILRPPGVGCGEPKGGVDNGPQVTRIKITDLLKGSESANPRVLSGDTVEVERASPVYVIGAVNSPRPIFASRELTLSRAIAMAGGPSKDATGEKATLFRHEGVERTAIEVDLGKISRSETVDIVLKPFDIIDVAGKGGGKRNFPPLSPDSTSSGEKKELPLRIIEPLR